MSLMLDEIRQQPEVLERTLRQEMRGIEALKKALTARRPKMVVLAARGTSDNAAQFGRYLLEISTGIPVSLAAPSIYTLYGAHVDLRDAMVVAISQSGESTDTNLVLERAKAAGALTVGVTNEPSSALANMAEFVILVRGGREKSVAATKTYTGQLLAMYLLAYSLGAAIDLDDVKRIPDWTASALELEKTIRGLAPRYRFMEHCVVVGRGLNYSNAFEFALKMMETCYVVAERFSSADFAHGPIAMVERSFPVFLFTPAGVTWPGLREMITRLNGMGAETVALADRSAGEALKAAQRSICVPARLLGKKRGKLPEDVFTPIPYIVPAQLFAAALAEEKGLNPDQPRSLEKVTRTL
ncbi:MAG: SIS domain-containing protein [Bryobacterales bacterium]|nr:SIS domain-containing protein [Bryobacterales bacterium]